MAQQPRQYASGSGRGSPSAPGQIAHEPEDAVVALYPYLTASCVPVQWPAKASHSLAQRKAVPVVQLSPACYAGAGF